MCLFLKKTTFPPTTSEQPVMAAARLCSGWVGEVSGGESGLQPCAKSIELMPDHALGVLTDVNHFKVPE